MTGPIEHRVVKEGWESGNSQGLIPKYAWHETMPSGVEYAVLPNIMNSLLHNNLLVRLKTLVVRLWLVREFSKTESRISSTNVGPIHELMHAGGGTSTLSWAHYTYYVQKSWLLMTWLARPPQWYSSARGRLQCQSSFNILSYATLKDTHTEVYGVSSILAQKAHEWGSWKRSDNSEHPHQQHIVWNSIFYHPFATLKLMIRVTCMGS